MNIRFFEEYMKNEPPDIERSYIFIVDNKELAENLVLQRFYAVAILENQNGFYNLESFLEYMKSIEFQGTYRSAYTYIPACDRKKTNDAVQEYFDSEYLKTQEGWKLFKGKEHLRKFENAQEVEEIVRNFISHFEQPVKYSESLKRFHQVDQNGKPTGVIDMEIVDHIISNQPFIVIGITPFVYENGKYYEDVKGIRLKTQIQKLVYREIIKAPIINRIYSLLISQPTVQRSFEDLYNYPMHWINFKNGFFDPIENKMIDHDPKYYSVNQISYEYHPEERNEILSGGEVITNYLSYSVSDILDQKMIWEYLGYCMTLDTQMQKFLMLLGNGGTGKSVIIHLFQQIIGMENCSSISLQDLNKRFYATGLFGKQLNACGDIPCRAMDNTDVVKKATGEDSLIYERKGQDAMQFISHAKLLFSSNDMPENLEEKSDAFYRRLLVIDMNRVVPKEKKDTRLKEKMNREVNYAIHKAVDALKDLYKNGAFTESDHSKEMVQEIQRASDSVKAFLDERIRGKKGQRLAKPKIYELYEEYCKEADRKPLGKKKFYLVLERKGYYSRKSNGIYFYDNLEERVEDFEPIDEIDNPFKENKTYLQMRLDGR